MVSGSMVGRALPYLCYGAGAGAGLAVDVSAVVVFVCDFSQMECTGILRPWQTLYSDWWISTLKKGSLVPKMDRGHAISG